MSSELESKHELIEWAKGGGLLIITLSGILLYVVFAVPATIFYDRLGTTPGEVGLSYASLLSGSTLGALAFVAVVFILLYYVAFGIVVAPVIMLTSLSPFFLWSMRRQRRSTSWDAKERNFERYLARAKTFYLSLAGSSTDKRAAWGQIEVAMRRMRELGQLGVLTAAQAAEYESLKPIVREIDLASLLADFPFSRIKPIFRIRRAAICALLVVIALPVLAFVQANYVRDGKSYPGSQLGIFYYHAEPATISPASTTAAPGIAKLAGQHLFLLGQNAQYVILYEPEAKLTMRIPVIQVIVNSRLSLTHLRLL